MTKYRITTPEQVTFHYAIAGVVSRCLAWSVDQLLIWCGYAAIIFAFASLGGGISIALIILGIFILDFSYFAFFELYRAGQSPGKRLFRIRVISARGQRLRFADVIVRNTMRPVDALPFAMVVGGCCAAVDRYHRRFGDLVADTIVVRDVRHVAPQALAAEKARVNSFQSDAAIRNRVLTRVTRDERDLILDLALRRDQIEPAVREELFARAAAHFRGRLALPHDLVDHLSDEQTVINLALLIQDAKFAA